MEKELVNHPKHYNNHPSGRECIEFIHSMSFNNGSAFKYIFRRDEKDKLLEDLKKARWYIMDEINRRKKRNFNKHIGRIYLVFNEIVRPSVYEFYFENFVACYQLNRYESDINIKRIYELIIRADYYFYEIKPLEDALIHLNFVIDVEETKENLKNE